MFGQGFRREQGFQLAHEVLCGLQFERRGGEADEKQARAGEVVRTRFQMPRGNETTPPATAWSLRQPA